MSAVHGRSLRLGRPRLKRQPLVRRRGEEYLAGLPEGAKRERMAAVFKAYMDGKSLKAVAKVTGMSQGSVSNYLNEIEKGAGGQILRRNAERGVRNAEHTELQVDREGGLRRASVRDFHSFRVTWVRLALTAGVPLELVQRVTGHKTTDIVLKHYFQPGREAFREALEKAMPALLTNGRQQEDGGSKKEDRKGEVLRILKGMTAKTWKRDQARLVKMLEAGWGRKAEC